jgi:spermidine/putrescine transport system ATP-binding protein
LSVRDNIAFGLRMKKTPASEVAVRVSQAMELVEIARLADRKPAQLSGGEQQRVAVARAIVNEPKVLLLDEPLGALDLKLRRQLQGELHALQRRLGITFIHVTHDQEEALAMSDRLAVMNAGRVEQLGVPKEVYERPRTRFVAQFLGACNLLDTTVLREDAASMWVASPLGQLRLTPAAKIRRPAAGASLAVAIRPEKVQLFTEAPPMENCVHAWLTELSYTGAQTQYLVAACGVPLEAAVVNAAGPQHLCQIGQEVWVHLPPEGLIILED